MTDPSPGMAAFAQQLFHWLMYLVGKLRKAGLALDESPFEDGELGELVSYVQSGLVTRREAQLCIQQMVAWQKDGSLAERRRDFAALMRERPDLNRFLVALQHSAEREVARA